MQQSTENTEQSTIQESAENNRNKNYSLIERNNIAGTPFTVIKNNETQKCFLAMGDYRLTEEMDNEDDIHHWIMENNWLLVTTIASIAAEKVYQLQTIQQTQGTLKHS